MGCKGSKEDKDDKKIDSSFEWIQITRFDDFFRSARDLLEAAEKIRSGLEDSREKGVEIANVHKLKDPKYNDVVQVLFWSLSAEAGGKVNNTGVTVGTEIPYIKLEKGKVSEDTQNLYENFATYVRTVTEGPSTLKEIVEKLTELSKQCPGIVSEGKAEIQNSSLDMAGKAQAIAKLGKNGNKLPKELKKCEKLQEIIKQAGTDLQESAPKFKDYYTQADEVGAKAAAEGLKKPGEICDKYHPGAKKADKEKKEKKEEKKEEDKDKKKEDKEAKKKEKDEKKKREKEEKEKEKEKKKKEKDEKKEEGKSEEKQDKPEKPEQQEQQEQKQQKSAQASENKIEEQATEKVEEKHEEKNEEGKVEDLN